MSKKHRLKISLATRGENNPRWKGDDVSYQALHNWVASKLGRPTKCDFCGLEDKKRARYFDWANKNHEYKRDLINWVRLCKKCHRDYDVKYNGR